MADIFISYKKEDAGRVVRIVEALRAEGLSVWWDHGITPGSQWDQTIQTQLNAAKAVVAVWSEASISAPWVKEEAGVAKNRGILLPVLIDDVEPPLGFSLIQAADLRGWDGDAKDPHFQHFLAALKAILSGERPVGLEAPRRRRGLPMGWLIGGGVALAALVAVALFLLGGGGGRIAVSPTPQGYEAKAEVGYAAPLGPVAPGDQELFERARESGAKTDFQDYLRAFPNGTHADEVRTILLTCRAETREVWNPGQAAQPVRGISVQSDLTQEQACQEATRMANTQADRNCAAIAGNVGYRNGAATVQPAACDCTQAAYGWSCTVDMAASCAWEQRVEQPVEVCG
jgi:hypothetical protein